MTDFLAGLYALMPGVIAYVLIFWLIHDYETNEDGW